MIFSARYANAASTGGKGFLDLKSRMAIPYKSIVRSTTIAVMVYSASLNQDG